MTLLSTSLSRRGALQWALASAAGSMPFLAQAQAIDAVKILAGFAAGGTVDTLARRVATQITGGYAKSAVVENKTGAGGQIAITTLKAAPADGATLLATPMSMLGIYPHTYKKLPYDPVADVTPVSLGVVFDMGFAVGPQVPASVKTVPEFLEWCKANPTGANFGSPAAGSVPHFIGVLLGRSCAGAGFDNEGWLIDAAELLEGDIQDNVRNALIGLQEMVKGELTGDDVTVVLLLPTDDAPLADRAAALGQWCQGFLSGFGLNCRDSSMLSTEATEVLQDLSAISQVQDALEESDDGESDYMEVMEYLRVAPLLLFTETNKTVAPAAKPSLH